MLFSFVIPCYNEGENVTLILNKITELFKDINNIQIVLVDNGSQDGSFDQFDKKDFSSINIKKIRVDENKGYGYGILQGLNAADGDFLGWTHADMQTDLADLIKATDIIKKKNFSKTTYVKGYRKGRSIFDNFFTIGMSFFETIYLKTKLNEINAQPNLFSREFFNQLNNPPYDFSFDLYFYYFAKKLNQDIERFDVLFPQRLHGESKWNNSLGDKWKFIKRTIKFSKEMKRGL